MCTQHDECGVVHTIDVRCWCCCCCCWFFLFVFLWLVNRIINHLTRAVYNKKKTTRRKKNSKYSKSIYVIRNNKTWSNCKETRMNWKWERKKNKKTKKERKETKSLKTRMKTSTSKGRIENEQDKEGKTNICLLHRSSTKKRRRWRMNELKRKQQHQQLQRITEEILNQREMIRTS